jgi:hypothetical protein
MADHRSPGGAALRGPVSPAPQWSTEAGDRLPPCNQLATENPKLGFGCH